MKPTLTLIEEIQALTRVCMNDEPLVDPLHIIVDVEISDLVQH